MADEEDALKEVYYALTQKEYESARTVIVFCLNSVSFIREYMTTVTRSERRSVLRKRAQKLYPTGPRQFQWTSTIPAMEYIRQNIDQILGMTEAISKKVTANTDMKNYKFKLTNVTCIPLDASNYNPSISTKEMEYTVDEAIQRTLSKKEPIKAWLDNSHMAKALFDRHQGKHPTGWINEDFMVSTELVNPNCPAGAENFLKHIHGKGIAIDIKSYFRKPIQESQFWEHTTYPQTSEKNMSQNIKLKTITFVNSKPISDYADEDLYVMIAGAEAKIKELEAIKNKPKKLVEEIAARKADIQTLVDFMDNK